MSGIESIPVIGYIIELIKSYWLWILISSVIATVGSLAVGFALIISLPPDYFTQKKRISRIRNPVLRVPLRVVKNIFGVLALLAGCIMSIGPGPGLLTLLVGAILCDFPGKRTLERKLVSRPFILSMINRIRIRHKHPPIFLDDIKQIDDDIKQIDDEENYS
jgi:hypothetical protein